MLYDNTVYVDIRKFSYNNINTDVNVEMMGVTIEKVNSPNILKFNAIFIVFISELISPYLTVIIYKV